MKYAETVPGAAVLVLRLLLVPAGRWALDWILVLALFWVAVVLTRDNPRARGWALAAACTWLAVIYAVSQGPHTFDAWH